MRRDTKPEKTSKGAKPKAAKPKRALRTPYVRPPARPAKTAPPLANQTKDKPPTPADVVRMLLSGVPAAPDAPPGAKPSKETTSRKERLLLAILTGANYTAAARYAGIAPRTLRAWMTEGRRASETAELPPPGDERKRFLRRRALYRAIVSAEAECEFNALRVIQVHAIMDWRAAAWWLERRRPKRWGRKDQVDARLRVTLDKELRGFLAALQKALKPAEYQRVLEIAGGPGVDPSDAPAADAASAGEGGAPEDSDGG